MPGNFEAPSHVAIRETAMAGSWREKLARFDHGSPVARLADYHAWLEPHAASLDIWETTYLQVLEGENPVAEWTKGTRLKPLLDALEEPDRGAFEAAYRARVATLYPKDHAGRTLFPFRRLFIVATRA